MKSPLLLAAVLLITTVTGCATTATITPEQRNAISAISLRSTQSETPITVEVVEIDGAAAGAQGGLVGIVLAKAMLDPGNRKRKMQSLLKAKAFNEVTGPIDSPAMLTHSLRQTLAGSRFSVDPQAAPYLTYKIQNRLSQDTRTLEMKTDYSLHQQTGDTIHQGAVSVQYEIHSKWTRERLLAQIQHSANESAQLIAMDLQGTAVAGERASVGYIVGELISNKKLRTVPSPAGHGYHRYRDNSGLLISVATESGNPRVRKFYELH